MIWIVLGGTFFMNIFYIFFVSWTWLFLNFSIYIKTKQGLADDLDLDLINSALKKTFKCNGSVTNDPKDGMIIQLSGDQRANVRSFFIDQEVCYEEEIVIHGG